MSDPPAPDLGAIRERHRQGACLFWWTRENGSRDEFYYCAGCNQRWQCEVARVLAAFDAQGARLAAQQPVMDAVLKLSTYSRETVDAGVQRIVETLGDYEDWLLEHPDEQ